MTRLEKLLLNLKNQSFVLIYEEGIEEMHIYYDELDNTINVKNMCHFASADYYQYNLEGIYKVFTRFESDLDQLEIEVQVLTK